MLTALLKTLSAACVPLFWEAVGKFSDLEAMQDGLTLLTWAMYFPSPSVDETSVAARVFAIMSGMVSVADHTPACPRCSGPTEFVEDVGDAFGWRYYCCGRRQRLSRAEARKRHRRATHQCNGSVSAAANTWFAGSKSAARSLYRPALLLAGSTASFCRGRRSVCLTHCCRQLQYVMGEDGDLQFGVPYRLPPRIAPGIHTVLPPNTGNHYFSPGRGAVRI